MTIQCHGMSLTKLMSHVFCHDMYIVMKLIECHVKKSPISHGVHDIPWKCPMSFHEVNKCHDMS